MQPIGGGAAAIFQPSTCWATGQPRLGSTVQVAEHERTGVWGIFEAKGGKSKLGSAYGGQMSGEWITRWIRKLIRKNKDGDAGRRLDAAYRSRRQMIASVTRFNLNVKKVNGRWASPEFKVAVQKYDPPKGNRMKPWGPGW